MLDVIKTINTFLPLVKNSSIKKVISITTGLADNKLTNDYNLYEAAPYTISKAALNTAVTKYNARHGKSSDGILLLVSVLGWSVLDTMRSVSVSNGVIHVLGLLTASTSPAGLEHATKVC